MREAKLRQPGMMLLIAMAITVAYVASMATSLGAFDLDFWWELAALVTIMLLGHWMEMKALGQPRTRWPSSRSCCRTRPSDAATTARRRRSPAAELKSAMSCWCVPVPRPRRR